jgi:NAD(P)-dependent dehydrogenase (short-subunit alcohol dehydrogenase family)
MACGAWTKRPGVSIGQAVVPLAVGRMGNLDDVVRAILFLGSRDAGFVNGEVLDVNGGMWCDYRTTWHRERNR